MNEFAAKVYKCFPPYLNNVPTLPLWNLKCLLYTCHHWVIIGRNSRIYSTSTLAPKLARFESSWLQRVASIGREDVQNTHHWSERTENSDWERSGSSWIKSSLLQPFVSGVVDSPTSAMRVLYTFCCNISHTLLSTAFKAGEFGGHTEVPLSLQACSVRHWMT